MPQSASSSTTMFLFHVFFVVSIWRFSRTESSVTYRRMTNLSPPSFRRTPTLVDCRNGTSLPLPNASSGDVSFLRTIHPHCPFSVLEFRETLPQCPDVSFCPREFRAISPCGDCCYVCREPNEDFMAQNSPTVTIGLNNSLHTSKQSSSGPCHNIKCKRYQKCVLNIQGLPVCRCFPVEMCSTQSVSGLPVAIGGKKKKEMKMEKEICGSDGVSYETKCHMQVAACQAKVHIRIAHKGACMKPAENSRRSEPSIKIKPNRGNRKQKQGNRRFLSSTSTTTVSPNVQPSHHGVVGNRNSQQSHPQPAIIVPIISPSSSLRGNRGRKQQGAFSQRGRSPTSSSSPPIGDPSSVNRDRIVVPLVVGKGNSGHRKSGRRDKTSRGPERPRGERTRLDRPGRNREKSLAKNERTERGGRIDRLDGTRGTSDQQSEWGRAERTDKVRSSAEQQVAGRFDRPDRSRFERPERTKFKSPRSERPRSGRPEKGKGAKKIMRLERKKQKLEKRLLKEKEKVRRNKS